MIDWKSILFIHLITNCASFAVTLLSDKAYAPSKLLQRPKLVSLKVLPTDQLSYTTPGSVIISYSWYGNGRYIIQVVFFCWRINVLGSRCSLSGQRMSYWAHLSIFTVWQWNVSLGGYWTSLYILSLDHKVKYANAIGIIKSRRVDCCVCARL